MNRRNFIKIMGAGAIVVAASPVVISHVGSKNSVTLRPTINYTDFRKKLISYAMLCPNPHNKQPWKVELKGKNTIRLFVDKERLLPQTDPIHRQIHIGQGTFIESLVIAASHDGLRADVTYFPLGEYDNRSLAELPVADIELLEDVTVVPDPLFSQLASRQSTKTPYSEDRLEKVHIEALHDAVAENGCKLIILDSDKDKVMMGNYLIDAMKIEESKRDRSLETISMFRFNDEEFMKYRDGFGLEQNGVLGIKKTVAETFFISRENAEKNPAAFGGEGVKHVQKIVANTHHYALLSTSDNDRVTQVKVGELYSRINLIASALGIAIHPMSQILQEYDDMASLQEKFKNHVGLKAGDTGQMLFRLGKADPTPLTPRREVSSVLL